jgi:hypothetical protein
VVVGIPRFHLKRVVRFSNSLNKHGAIPLLSMGENFCGSR